MCFEFLRSHVCIALLLSEWLVGKALGLLGTFFLTTESGNPIRMYLCLPRTPLLTSIVMTSASTPIRATE